MAKIRCVRFHNPAAGYLPTCARYLPTCARDDVQASRLLHDWLEGRPISNGHFIVDAGKLAAAGAQAYKLAWGRRHGAAEPLVVA